MPEQRFDFNKKNTASPAPTERGPPRNGPVWSQKAGGLQVAIWENETTTAEGQVQAYHTVSLERRYRDKSGEWKSTNTLRENDLPKAIVLLQKAYETLLLGGEGDE